jgi:hypothetical protein
MTIDIFLFASSTVLITLTLWCHALYLQFQRYYFRYHRYRRHRRYNDQDSRDVDEDDDDDDDERKVVCNDSSNPQDAYARRYQIAKKQGKFRDRQLYHFIDSCKKQRQQLQPISDLSSTNSSSQDEKIRQLKIKQQQQQPQGPLQISPKRLQDIRHSLNAVPPKRAHTASATTTSS